MRKLLYITMLGFLAISCTAQNPTTTNSSTTQKNTNVSAVPPAPSVPTTTKPPIEYRAGYEFYTKNIGDVKKNDNTASYGSIVSAKPIGYKISKAHFPALNQNFRVRYLILHYTAMADDRSIVALTSRGVSSHYLVNNMEDNEIYQLVDENKRAYHAGISSWRSDKSLNDTSIGIEIVNDGYKMDSLNQRQFFPYSETQFKKIAALVKDIVERYQIPPTNILGHSDIAPTRKQDPGPLFPWKRLYDEYKIGMWYDEDAKQRFIIQASNADFFNQNTTSAFIYKVQSALQNFGYDIQPSGTWDKNSTLVLQSFQYHFRPTKADGILDIETWAILQALQAKYPNK